MLLEVAGVHYAGFTSALLTLELNRLVNEIRFGASDPEGGPLPFVQGQSARVYIDGERMFDGFLERIDVNGGADEHNVSIYGRDRVADLADGEIGSLSAVPAPFTLKRICELVIEHLAGPGEEPQMQVVDLSDAAPFNKEEDVFNPEPGDNAAEALEVWARKRQVLMTSDGLGRLVLSNGKGEPTGARVIHQDGNPNNLNNVLRYSMGYDGALQFHRYLVMTGESASAGFGGFLGTGSTDLPLASIVGESINPLGRIGRQRVIAGESPGSQAEANKRAAWEHKYRRATATVYSATVDGYRNQDGQIWRPNTVVLVSDDKCNVHRDMLINSVAFSIDPDTKGRVTNLSFIEEDAYTTSLEEPQKDGAKKAKAWPQLLRSTQQELAAQETAIVAANKKED